MQTSVLGLESSQTFAHVTDSESELAGADESGAYLCRPRIYSLIDAPPSLTLSQETRTLNLVTDDFDTIGQYTVRMQVQLKNYPDIVSETSFTVTI